jgi:hypothetical protein
MLSSVSTRVLINGHLSSIICHVRGLSRGDPLSPLLFIIMDVMNAMVLKFESSEYWQVWNNRVFGIDFLFSLMMRLGLSRLYQMCSLR